MSIQEEIDKAITSLEDKLKKIGFNDADLSELKLDLEVGISNKASLSEIIGILKESEKKVINKSKKKTEEKVVKGILGNSSFTRDYTSDALEDTLESIPLEVLEEVEEKKRELEEKLGGANNQYFSRSENKEEFGASYFSNEEQHYISNTGPTESTRDIVNQEREQEKKKREYQAQGKTASFGEDPSSFYK